MTTSITVLQQKAIDTWTREDIELAKILMKVPASATETDWMKLVLLAKKYQLDPLMNEIWITDAGVFVGLDGLKTIANQTGMFDGIESNVFNKDGSLWVGDDGCLPAYATCTVRKKGCSYGFTKTVTWRDFGKQTQKGGSSWDKMPGYMLDKVATSHALKLAFNMNGLYIPEEFGVPDKNDDAYGGSVIDITPEPIPATPIPQKSEQKYNDFGKGRAKYSDIEMKKIKENFFNNSGRVMTSDELDSCRCGPDVYDKIAVDELYKKVVNATRG